MDIEKILPYLKHRLLQNNFILHEYKSYSSNSKYLKLDYGACNTIRISDHEGYGHLKYKYKVNTKYKNSGWVKDFSGAWTYQCPATRKELNKLINIIIADRQYKEKKYNYNLLINECIKRSQNSKGFWQKCKEVENNGDRF